MASTTENQAPKDEVIISRSVTKKDIVDAHVKGWNYYKIAREFFGSESDDAVARVASVVEAEFPEPSAED